MPNVEEEKNQVENASDRTPTDTPNVEEETNQVGYESDRYSTGVPYIEEQTNQVDYESFRDSTGALVKTWVDEDLGNNDRRETNLDLHRNTDVPLDLVEYLTNDTINLKITPLKQESELRDKPKEPEFEEVDCGEPFREQHFYIDFTPIPGIDDDEELFKKNDEFWNFVNSNEVMRQMMYGVEEVPQSRLNFPSIPTTESSSKLSSRDILAGAYWLDRDEIDLGATSKLPVKYCDDDGGQYFSEDDILKKRQDNFEKLKTVLKIKKLPQRSSQESKTFKSSSLNKTCLQKLRRDMREFDSKNPKSFEPPGRAPELITATLQRHPYRGVIPDSESDVFKHFNTPNTD